VLNLFTKRWQTAAAWICLAAVVLLFAPMAGAAWNAYAMSCCNADHCPIPEHHHSKAAQHGQDCDSEKNGMDACSMRCCQSSDHPAVTALIFVMPDGVSVVGPNAVTPAPPNAQANNFLCTLEVSSPPPRHAFSL
jgi:hypothetical protein